MVFWSNKQEIWEGMKEIGRLTEAAREIRVNLLKLCHKEKLHIGGDLSVADMMTVLWLYQMKYDPSNPKDENRDRFILSKGHASAVTSFCQAAAGCFQTSDVMQEYAVEGGRFSMHPCSLVNPYVEISTGSLGHGLSIACGIAQGLRMKGNQESRVYVVMGDGEQGEGSVWEASVYAVRLGLGNLVAIIDNNGLQADSIFADSTGIKSIAESYKTNGWNVVEIDGNNIQQVKETFDNLKDACTNVPTAIIGHTVKGKGVSFMENDVEWHAGKINAEQLQIALAGLEDGA